jgi:adenylate cyclase
MEGLAFSGFWFDHRGLRLYRPDARDEPMEIKPPLPRKTLQVLKVLLERPGKTVTRDEFIKEIWGRSVGPEIVDVHIVGLREILETKTSRENKKFEVIENVRKRGNDSPGGYQLLVPVKLVERAVSPPPERQSEAQRPPRRLSIVVLPFADYSEDQTKQYFIDAITEDLTTDLSRIDGMFVISRNTAFTYRDRSVSTKQIGRELNVRYVLEGSVQRAGNRVRVTAQLIDSETDGHSWSRRFDRDINDLFALQDEIISRIAVELNLVLINAEAARPTDRLDVADYIFRGRAIAAGKAPSVENCAEAIGLFEHALTLDPNSVGAQSWLAIVLGNRLLDFPAHAADGDLERADELASKAVAAAPRSSVAHFAKGQVLRVQKRYEEAIAEYETVLTLNRNWAGAIFVLAWCKFHTGLIEETIPLLEQLIRLSPRDPYMGIWYGRIGIAHLLQSRLDEAIVWLEKARSAIPARPWTRSSLAVAYAHKGETELAAAEIAEARRLSPDGRYTSIARLKEVGYLGVPEIRTLFETVYLTGYRKAGVPEE